MSSAGGDGVVEVKRFCCNSARISAIVFLLIDLLKLAVPRSPDESRLLLVLKEKRSGKGLGGGLSKSGDS